MLMEAQAQGIPSNGRSSAAQESSKELHESTLEEKAGSQDASRVPSVHPQRNLPGTKDEVQRVVQPCSSMLAAWALFNSAP